MAKTRFTSEQIADFLQQSKNGVSNKVLCERYEFSVSTLVVGRSSTPKAFAVS